MMKLLVNRWLGWVVLAPVVLMIAVTAWQLDRVSKDPQVSSLIVANEALSGKRNLNDFDEFYLVGRLYKEGDILSSYDMDHLLAAQQRFTGVQSFLPWTYPPQFTALMALLPLVSIGWSFLLFTGGTLAFFVVIARRFQWDMMGASLLAIMPSLMLNARLGQNGFLTAGLIGLILLAFRDSRNRGGIPLGLMAMKPHLAAALGLLALLERRWTMVVTVAVTIAVTCALATLVLGVEAWPAWFAGVRQSSGFLHDGVYSLYRMSSVYGAVRSFGAPAGVAFGFHFAVAIGVVSTLLLAFWRKWPRRHLLAVAALANVFISPYNHDYDYVSLALALSLILPELLTKIRPAELVAFYILSWIGTGAGLAQHLRAVLIEGTIVHPRHTSLDWSFQAPAVIMAAALVAMVLRRRQRLVVASDPGGSTQARPEAA
jgi:hypothetical protein